MGKTVTSGALTRHFGFYLRLAQHRVIAVTRRGAVAAYLISPAAYMRILQGQTLREQGHQEAVARMDEEWAKRERN